MLKLRALLFAVFLTLSLDSSGRELLAGLERISFSSFRPDGWDIWLLEPNRPPQRLTDQPALDYDPAWSPDGRYIVFTSGRFGEPDLFVIDTLKRGQERPLIIGEGMKDQAAFSPDGRRILFTSTRDAIDRGDKRFPFAIQTTGNLYAMETKSGEVTRLTRTDGWDGCAVYAPDGKRIYFYSDRLVPHDPRLFAMNSDGSDQHPMGPLQRAISPAVENFV